MLNPVISSVRMISLLFFLNSIFAHLLITFNLFTAQFDRNTSTTCIEHNILIVVVVYMMKLQQNEPNIITN